MASQSRQGRCFYSKKKKPRGFWTLTGLDKKPVWHAVCPRITNRPSLGSEIETQNTDQLHVAFVGHSQQVSLDPDFDPQHVEEPATAAVSSYVAKRKKVSQQWNAIRTQMINALVSSAAPSTWNCCCCGIKDDKIIRCLDCGPSAYFCLDCCNKHHAITLLHQPQMWNPKLCCFEDCANNVSWQAPDKHKCASGSVANIIIIDEKGRQHYQQIETCQCLPLPVQMMKYHLWPASPSNPKIAFTMDLMCTLRAMILEGQMSLHSFATALQECRSSLFVEKDNDLIKDIHRVFNWESVLNFMWIHHNISNLQFPDIGLPDGSICRICPETNDGEMRRMTMDGNFNLVRRIKAGHSVREPLHKNRFFLPQDQVDLYVAEQGDATRPLDQNCSNFQAADVIRSKNKTEKLEFTGVFASVCSHDFPCKIFNLRHGERMAYPIFMMKNLENVGVLMYDIGCQLETVLKKRNIPYEVTFAVPIFHVFGHQLSCQLKYSPRAISGVGLFDGEGSERCWSYLGKFSLVTKEMMPENRQDLLTEALLNYGQKITCKIDHTLGRRLAKAHMIHESTSQQLTDGLQQLPGTTVDNIDEWRRDEIEHSVMCKKKKPSESWKSAYALELNEYFNCQECDAEETTEDLARIETKLKRREKCQKLLRRWTQSSKLYNSHLNIACSDQRQAKLTELREAVVQYNHMIYIKSKYARGQSLAKRITKQLLVASKKVNSVLTLYNDVPPRGTCRLPLKLQRSEVMALDSSVWHHLSSTSVDDENIPSVVKRNLIDTMKLHMRAKEEIGMLLSDMDRLVRSFDNQLSIISSHIELLQCKDERDSIECGCLSLLVRHCYQLKIKKNNVIAMLNKARGCNELNVFDFVSSVDNYCVNSVGTTVRGDLVDAIAEVNDLADLADDDVLE